MSTPAVRDLDHLRQILRAELERAKREGQSTLYLDGCTTTDARNLVETLARDIASLDPDGRLLALAPTTRGYAVTFARGGTPAPTIDQELPGDDYLISHSAF